MGSLVASRWVALRVAMWDFVGIPVVSRWVALWVVMWVARWDFLGSPVGSPSGIPVGSHVGLCGLPCG